MIGLIAFVIIFAGLLAGVLNPIIINRERKQKAIDKGQKYYYDDKYINKLVSNDHITHNIDGAWVDIISGEIIEDEKDNKINLLINEPAKRKGFKGYAKRVVTEKIGETNLPLYIDVVWFEIETNRPYILVDNFSLRNKGKRYAKYYYMDNIPRHIRTGNDKIQFSLTDEDKKIIDYTSAVYMSETEFKKWNLSLNNML